jgi:cysteine desulfurase/selenocysteine lyase
MNRDDFKILKEDFIFFDNCATTLKPNIVVDETVKYYTEYTSNAHRGDYDNSIKVDTLYEETRTKVRKLINAESDSEIVFTSGATESLNLVVFGFMKYNLKKGDEVLLTKAEHASNVLPWLELANEKGIKIKYIPLDKDHKLDYDELVKMISPKTKVISIAHVTNTIGDIRPVEKIGKLCKDNNIYFVVDGAQSIPHFKVDVLKNNIDFLAFSAHKMLGPTGVGVLYGKYDLLNETRPINFGGGMNNIFESTGEVEYKSIPTRFEAGTPNIAGVIGFNRAIDYINSIGYDAIERQEKKLRKYLIDNLKKIDNVILYNENSDTGIVLFNLKDIFSQDTSVYLNTYHICVRAGNHCAKILKDELGIRNTCRISLYFYNTKEEIDVLIEALKKSKNIFEVVI